MRIRNDMSTRMINDAPETKASHTKSVAVKILSPTAKVLSMALVIICLICLIACVYLLIMEGLSSAFFAFAQWTLLSALYGLISRNIHELFASVNSSDGNGFTSESPSLFCAKQQRLLRQTSLCFLGITIGGFAFSFAAAFIAHESIPAINISFPLAGFPSPDTWAIALGETSTPSVQAITSVDIASAFAALVLWSLSYVFEYANWLQEEHELTF